MPARNPPTTGYGTNRTSVAEPEHPEHQEHDPAQDRHHQGRGDHGQEDVGTLVVLQPGLPGDVRRGRRPSPPRWRRRARARPPPRPARFRRRPGRRPATRGTRASARPLRGTGRCHRAGGPPSKPPKTKAANAIASTDSTAPMITPAATEASHRWIVAVRPSVAPPFRQSSSASNARIVSVSRSASVVASHRCSAAASSGSSASIRSIDSRPRRRTTLGVSATTSAVRATPCRARSRRPPPPGAPSAAGAACPRPSTVSTPRPPGLEHEDVTRRLVLVEQHGALGHRHALEVGGEARRQAVEARRRVLATASAGGVAEQHVLAPLQPAIEVGLERHDPVGRPPRPARAARGPDPTRP